MSNYLLTGVAGFIGYKVAEKLLADGHFVYGVDDLNDAYDVRLKHYRLDLLKRFSDFHFAKLDISHRVNMKAISGFIPGDVAGCINLAARAGVRTSLTDPLGLREYQYDGHLEPVRTLSTPID